MRLTFSPLRCDARLSLQRAGDVLTINGEAFDFDPLPEGATLPREAIDSPWFAGPVERRGGALHIRLFLPHGPGAPHRTRFPTPVVVTADGAIPLPPPELPETEAPDAED